jgi:hypothetical protein
MSRDLEKAFASFDVGEDSPDCVVFATYDDYAAFCKSQNVTPFAQEEMDAHE